jgi:hypothetical protein
MIEGEGGDEVKINPTTMRTHMLYGLYTHLGAFVLIVGITSDAIVPPYL